MTTCFAIMPFSKRFDDIDRIIRKAATGCELEYVRGDLSERPGSIMPQVLHEIRRATVVVADITDHNPNVFYELGIAHQLKGPERVVIITQGVDGKKAYDVHQFRQLIYAHTTPGRALLRKELPARIKEAARAGADEELWSVVRGCHPRTSLIVRDLQRLTENARPKSLKNTTIRVVAGLSSLAISDNEPPDPKNGEVYNEALRAERDSLRKALLCGAKLKAVLNPPRRFAKLMQPERLRVRYKRLIGLLEGHSDIRRNPKLAAQDVKAMRQCSFALSPVSMTNMFIIGESVAYEGMKRGGTGGFEMTHCETSPAGLRDLIRQFDNYFEESRDEMRRSHPPDGRMANQLRHFYREADSIGR